jgi:hypothetical protein
LITFKIFFLHFYTNFSYENNFKFEDFYCQELINNFTKLKILIKEVKQFKIFSYFFYEQLIKEINKIDYKKIKFLYQYYNPNSLENQERIMDQNNSRNIFDACKSYLKNLDKNNFLKIQNYTNKIFKPIIITIERYIDLVLQVNKLYLKNKLIFLIFYFNDLFFLFNFLFNRMI